MVSTVTQITLQILPRSTRRTLSTAGTGLSLYGHMYVSLRFDEEIERFMCVISKKKQKKTETYSDITRPKVEGTTEVLYAFYYLQKKSPLIYIIVDSTYNGLS